LRVLLFCGTDMARATGSAIRGRLIAEGLQLNGASVCVVAPGVPGAFEALSIQSVLLSDGTTLGTTLVEAVTTFHPDIVYGITEAWADVVVDVASSNRCAAAFDMHGIGVVEILELGRGYGPRLPRLKNSAKWLRAMRKADVITVANPTLAPIARFLYRHVVPIIGLADTTTFSPDGLVVRIGSDAASLQLLYAGNHYKWQGMELLLAAFRRLVRDDAPVELTILGSAGEALSEGACLRTGIPEGRVHFVPAVNYGDVPAYYRGADVLLIPRPRMMSTHLAFPQKVVDYMASGRAIVATDLAPHRWALQDSEAGILCRPTPRGLAAGIRRSYDSSLREQCGKQARARAVALFDHVRQSQRILAEFEKLFERKGTR